MTSSNTGRQYLILVTLTSGQIVQTWQTSHLLDVADEDDRPSDAACRAAKVAYPGCVEARVAIDHGRMVCRAGVEA